MRVTHDMRCQRDNTMDDLLSKWLTDNLLLILELSVELGAKMVVVDLLNLCHKVELVKSYRDVRGKESRTYCRSETDLL